MSKKLTAIFIFFVLFYLTYGIIVSRFELTVIPKELQANHPSGYYDYRGVVNVHTTASTGSGSVEDVILSAQEADLDFLVITDLNDFSKPIHIEGYHSNLLVFIEGEYSYLDARLLVMASEKEDTEIQSLGSSQAHLSDLLSREEKDESSGIVVLAHPFKPGYSWTGQIPSGLDGIEIINLRSIWERTWVFDKASFFWTLLIYPFNADLAFIRMFGYPEKELKLWDSLNEQRPTLGFAGSDAESRIRVFRNSFLELPSYKTLFSITSNHVLLESELTGDAEGDLRKIEGALRKGQFYMSFDMLANPKGFLAVLRDADGQTHPLGASVPWSEGMKLEVTLPSRPLTDFEVVIVHDGKRSKGYRDLTTIYPIEDPGVYRVMVRVIPTFPLPDGRKWIPWIFTNPIFVR